MAELVYALDSGSSSCKGLGVQIPLSAQKIIRKIKIINGKHKTKRLHYGVCTVVVSSRYLKEKMLVWLSLFPETLIKREYY